MNLRIPLIGLVSSLALVAAVQAQANSYFDGNPDLYGHVLVSPPHANTDAVRERGAGDTYGSVLLDQDSVRPDAYVERRKDAYYGIVVPGTES